MPDYTNQLNALVAAISHRELLPQWAVGMIGVAFGAGLGALSALSIQKHRDFTIRRRIERAVYRELLNDYWEVILMRQRLMNGSNTRDGIQEEAAERIGFDACQYARTKPDVFYDLTFVADIEEVYRFFKKVIEPNPNIMNLVQKVNICIDLCEQKIANRSFDVKAIRAVCPTLIRDRVEELLNGRRRPGGDLEDVDSQPQ